MAAAPILRTRNLHQLVTFYVEALDFRVVQLVPHVAALLSCGSFQLQLWQWERASGRCVATLEAGTRTIFDLHARFARHGRSLLSGPPELRAWGAFEFGLVDFEGNQLVFLQWTVGAGERPCRAGARKFPG